MELDDHNLFCTLPTTWGGHNAYMHTQNINVKMDQTFSVNVMVFIVGEIEVPSLLALLGLHKVLHVQLDPAKTNLSSICCKTILNDDRHKSYYLKCQVSHMHYSLFASGCQICQ